MRKHMRTGCPAKRIAVTLRPYHATTSCNTTSPAKIGDSPALAALHPQRRSSTTGPWFLKMEEQPLARLRPAKPEIYDFNAKTAQDTRATAHDPNAQAYA